MERKMQEIAQAKSELGKSLFAKFNFLWISKVYFHVYFIAASQKAGKKWSLEDDEEEEEEDTRLKAEAMKSEPLETIQEEMEVVAEEDEVDPLDAFMKVLLALFL